MNERLLSDEPRRTRFFTEEDHGEFTVLRFGSHGAEDAIDLDEARRLWEFFAGGRCGSKKVLLITNAPGGLSPASLDRFWNHVHDDGTTSGSSWAATLTHVNAARQENAFKQFVENVRKIDSLVISVLQGECDFCFLGAALACDYRIAAQDTLFVNRLFESEATAGLLPWFLSRFLGHAQAADILLEGRSLTASEAYELKLVNKLAVPSALEQVALTTARRFASIPAPTLRALKRSLVASIEGLEAYLDQIGAGFHYVKSPPAVGMW